MRPLTLIFLAVFAVFSFSCTPSEAPPPERNYLEEIVLGLGTVGITAQQLKQTAVQNENGVACSAYAGLAAVAPVAGRVIAMVGSGGGISEIPGVTWDASECGAFLGSDLAVDIGERLARQVSDGLATVDNLITLWSGPFKKQSCPGYVAAVSGVTWAKSIVPQILESLRTAVWTVSAPPVPIDFSVCTLTAVVE